MLLAKKYVRSLYIIENCKYKQCVELRNKYAYIKSKKEVEI